MIAQIIMLDMVFSIDSVITAVGMTEFVSVMVAANVSALVVMLVLGKAISSFVERHPSVKVLALSFLLMIDDRTIWSALIGGDHRDWGARLEAAYSPGPAAPRLPAWAARVPIWLLTNHRTAWIEQRLVRFGLRPWFRRVLVSDALGALKPETSVFAPLLAHVRDPAAVLFVDDQEKNVTAAAALGLSVVLAGSGGRWISDVDRRLIV